MHTLNTAALEKVLDALQESDLPYLVDLHDWANLPKAFREQISRSYCELQGPSQPS